MPVQRLNSTDIYYEIHGEGPAVVFIPGVAVSHGMWAPQVAAFQNSHQVITYDVRGTGRSGKMAWSTRIEDHARDLASLLRFLKIKEAAVCGVSFGGVIAQRFALNYPRLCRALILVDTFSELKPRDREEASLWLMTWLASPMFLLPKPWLTSILMDFYEPWPYAQQVLRAEVPKIRGLDAVKTRWMIRKVDFTRTLAQIQCPCLGIVGGESELAIRMMKRLIKAIPDASLQVVPDSFDPTSLCQREEFNCLLADFFHRIGWQAGMDVEPLYPNVGFTHKIERRRNPEGVRTYEWKRERKWVR
ncbi:alpha/beta fold hydrolase [Heliobacterium chlorum]|uniref:Alpha/beta fold hydrolase n=1 Tax=Heliobacterium chlorum TaxID=2698 RepID=A0ABR7T6F1_HELCL|nr:alpha/beta hydrolase [Heliobacterium chlorum]MBC9786358.1 alpha/beta fold hydrolase [Heliobacterium chlorum]